MKYYNNVGKHKIPQPLNCNNSQAITEKKTTGTYKLKLLDDKGIFCDLVEISHICYNYKNQTPSDQNGQSFSNLVYGGESQMLHRF